MTYQTHFRGLGILFFIAAGLSALAAPATRPSPVPAGEAAARFTLPAGFRATLFAGEPDVVQPISFTFDDRGRVWVVEGLSYPYWQPQISEGKKDRIVILEDTDGDGRFDKRTVFWEGGPAVSSVELGFGGVYVLAAPNLLFIPDRNHDDVPDGPAEVLLDGWSLKAQHNFVNQLTWGPDGWLYGCNGILDTSYVGRPGTAAEKRVAMNCGVWRFHPVHKTFEVVAWGTTNPWGMDFDENGQIFTTNCVIAHLWHVIPGAHYQRMYGQDLNPYAYGLMGTIADHLHWGGGAWTESRGGEGKHSLAGGGHAHVGCMIYLGDNWPQEYRGGVFMCNLHGNRVNHDLLEAKGSGYVAHHGKDFLLANDPWFRGVTIKYGPDGGVFVSDWSDTGECHNYDRVDRSNGRIFKVTYGEARRPEVGDVGRLSDGGLVKLQLQRNEWFARHARRVLQERAAAGTPDSGAAGELREMVEAGATVAIRLRAMWALYGVGGFNEGVGAALLGSPDEYVRAWAIHLLCEGGTPSAAVMAKFAEMARGDSSAVVRLHLASALQRVGVGERLPVLQGLLTRGEDAGDANIPLMLWYAAEPVVAADPARGLALVAKSKIPVVREFLARRVTAMEPDAVASGGGM